MRTSWKFTQSVLVLTTAFLLTIGLPGKLSADETDPMLAPVPEPGINSTVQGLVVHFKYDPWTPAEFVGAILSQVPPRQRISAAPQLQIIALDRFGYMLDIFFVDYNHWTYINDENGQESKTEEYGRTGQFILPFDTQIANFVIRDYPLRKTVLEINTESMFRQFCEQQLIDEPIVCDFELPEVSFMDGFE